MIDIEEYISSLKWSEHATETEKTLVTGNLRTLHAKMRERQVRESAEQKLAQQGVFKGHEGLRGLAEASEFWAEQPYGTRLYYGPGGLQYLHRSVLQAAVEALDAPSETDRIERLEGLLREALADTDSDVLAERINAALEDPK